MNTIKRLYLWIVRIVFYFWPDNYSSNLIRGWFVGKALKKCGKNFKVAHDVVFRNLHLISIGDNVTIGFGVVFMGGEITVGSDIGIGAHTLLVAGNHTFNGQNYRKGYVQGKIVIEDGAWVGGNSTLLNGTRIPKACVVGAGSVCSKDYVQEGYLIAGVPAKPIKKMEPQI